MTVATAAKWVDQYNAGGWQSLLSVQAPRGGDFLAGYDQGYWAERLVRTCLDLSRTTRAVPYGTSRSEPFTDMEAFRAYAVNEFLLQAWSGAGRWKRPDLLLIPRGVLRREKGNDTWTPDLKHLDNTHCDPYVQSAAAAVEVETSLWQVQVATVPLSFTIKDEDLGALRNWTQASDTPLYIVQVFYDQAYVLAFETLERLIGLPADDPGRVSPEVDPTTNKATYKVPLQEGSLLGNIQEPEVEGKVFKAANGRVTVYGRLTGSAIDVANTEILEGLARGCL